jgi:transcriptional regulator with PAS, ATPase and Fis domain
LQIYGKLEDCAKQCDGSVRQSHAAKTLEQMERRHIEVVLEQAMTLEEAAEMLGINFATLWRKRRRYGPD